MFFYSWADDDGVGQVVPRFICNFIFIFVPGDAREYIYSYMKKKINSVNRCNDVDISMRRPAMLKCIVPICGSCAFRSRVMFCGADGRIIQLRGSQYPVCRPRRIRIGTNQLACQGQGQEIARMLVLVSNMPNYSQKKSLDPGFWNRPVHLSAMAVSSPANKR